MKQTDPIVAALAALIILQGVMLLSLFAGIAPHPPAHTPLFGIAPFIAMSLAAAAAAIILGPNANKAAKTLAILAGVAALISFGPQKYFDAQFGQIWPAVLSGQIAVLVIFAKIGLGTVPSSQELSA